MTRLAGAAIVVASSGCNALFGLDGEAILRDAPPLPDAPRLITPPPGPTVCPSVDLTTFTFAPTGLLATPPAEWISFSPFLDGGGVVRGFASTTARTIVELDLEGGATELTSLTAVGGAVLKNVHSTPDGSVVWFRQDAVAGGAFYATRADGWVKVPADFGFLDVLAISPGGFAFHDGTARMVVHVTDATSTDIFYELESDDGLAWRRLDTIKFATLPGENGRQDPALDFDGCVLVFSIRTGVEHQLFAVARDANGEFSAAPTRISPNTGGAIFDSPTFAPGQAAMFAVENRPALPPDPSYRLIRGAP